MRKTLAAFAFTAAAILPAAAETVTVWGKPATVIAGPMRSGRPGFDAVRVRFAETGREAFVLRRVAVERAGRLIPCGEAVTDFEVEACTDQPVR